MNKKGENMWENKKGYTFENKTIENNIQIRNSIFLHNKASIAKNC